MLALIYLGLAIYLGDLLCHRFYRFVSVPHRWAAAILVGILLSTWFTYLAGLAFAHTADALLWADLLFFVVASGAIFWLSRKASKVDVIGPRAPGSSRWDWITLGALFAAVCVLLMGTLYVNKQGRLYLSGMEASDFAPQSAIAQSFAFGNNFPTQNPYFAGQPIDSSFLFYFQAGNLEFLGLNLAWSVNVLSVLGLASVLALVMTLGELLFTSRVVGRVGAALFFFTGSLAFIPFLRSHPSINEALGAIVHLKSFLPSGYSYRADICMPIAFVTHWHLPIAIGVFLLVLIFLVDQYRQAEPWRQATVTYQTQNREARAKNALASGSTFVFSGFLLGALPLWNTPVFIAAAAMLLLLLILFPCRLQLLLLGLISAALALPQIALLRLDNIGTAGQPPSHSITNLISYVGFTFGAKWLLIAFALIMAAWFQRRFFIALCSLLVLALWLRLSTATSASDHLLDIWLIVANLFAAYGLWRLWKLKTPPIIGRVAAIVLIAIVVTGGVIDVFPIRNSSYVELNYMRDPLVEWIPKNTKPKDVFLTDRFLNHSILLAGRKVFFGGRTSLWRPDFANREPIYRQMFESKNPRRVVELLKENHIDFVAIDDGIRNGDLIRDPNEYLYVRDFQKVYEDKENRYRKLVIYKVPEAIPAGLPNMDLSEPGVTAFQGGHGRRKGQFDDPRALAVDSAGNIYVADTNNGRVQKFSPNGTFVTQIGPFDGPNGIAIDRAGNIYVAEIGSKHRVQKLGPDGTFIAAWAPGLYGPRKIAIGPDDSIYVADGGRSRIVKFSPDGQVLATWGSMGSSDGQFRAPNSVGVDSATNRVYVADSENGRIQVFDADGNFLAKWSVPEWGQSLGYEDLAIDSQRGRLYASSAHMNSILVFDLQGNRLGTLAPTPPDKLDGPSALALAQDKLFVLNAASARVSVIPLQNR
jgi:DNA-binding beta-propeller fold protein YncE